MPDPSSESPSLAEKAAALPRRSGVYLFRDAAGHVLYVGKAKDLRSRVRQYINGHDERFMVRFLVAQAADVDVVVTDSEKEALILENTLIKRYRPRYNVQLRDDKNFLHLRLDPAQAWPRYTLVREMKADGARYFGPYSSARKARSTLAFLQRSFPLRTCSDKVLAARRRPCLLHQMGRCVAPCVEGYTTKEDYAELIEQSAMLLEGRNQDLTERLREKMLEAAEAEAFEQAARLRDLLREIQATLERQKVADAKLED
ncbi:MAG: GIY-YIG nuclease family protein, partial [Alphaproteobacteria bacterium]|nr:GIY-YIG nuclease family protein [Alphaproteobacteria bacterium]